MLAALYNIPSDPQTLARFSFHNADSHALAARAIHALTGLTLPEFVIDPIPPNDFPGWLYNHQAMHNSVNGVLGLVGNDLSDVDPRKLDQLTYWVQIHASEHVQWADRLGFG